MQLPGAVEDMDRIAVTESVTVNAPDGALDAYLARPAGQPAAPGLLVLHEAFGMVEHIKDMARRFANLGYNVLAPNLYSRGGALDPSDMSDVQRRMQGLSDASVVRDLEACAAHLRTLGGATKRVGCIGFCSGGRQSLLFACSSAEIDAAIDCWGGWIERASADDPTTPERPTPVMQLVGDLKCPLFVAVGVEDKNPSPEMASEIRRRLEDSDQPATVKLFEGAGHAFLADYRPTYREGPAFELWGDIQTFLDTHLC